MENGREVKKSFCLLSVAYIVLGLVLVIWPDISVHTFCFVFGIGMIIFGGAHMILYFTKDRFMNVMQPDLVIGVVCISTGCYILMKMEYMLEIIQSQHHRVDQRREFIDTLKEDLKRFL